MRNSIIIVVFVFNEEKGIALIIENLLEVVLKFFKNYCFVIYNDGSTDNTGKIAHQLAETHDLITVVYYSKSKNIGYIYKIGFKGCKTEYYMMIYG